MSNQEKLVDFQNNEQTENNELPMWANISKKKKKQKDTIMSILQKTPIFSTLNKKELKKVSLIVYERNYSAEEFLFKEGNPGSGMFIIQEGKICVEKTSETGGTICLANLDAGDFVGELSLLDDSARSASARCLVITRVLAFFRQDLFDLIEREPLVGTKILKELALMIGDRLKETNKLLQHYTRLYNNKDKQLIDLEKKYSESNKLLIKYKKMAEGK